MTQGVRRTVDKDKKKRVLVQRSEDPMPDLGDSDGEDLPAQAAAEESDDDSGTEDEDDHDVVGSKELRAAPVKRASTTDAPLGNLSQHSKKTKTTGKGENLLMSKIAYLFAEADAKHNPDRVGFLQVRLVGPRKPKSQLKPKVQRKKDGYKNLRFSNCSPDIQKGLRKSRVTEWQKWKQFNAGVILTRKEVRGLHDEGVTVQPMQWVETDTNSPLAQRW